MTDVLNGISHFLGICVGIVLILFVLGYALQSAPPSPPPDNPPKKKSHYHLVYNNNTIDNKTNGGGDNPPPDNGNVEHYDSMDPFKSELSNY